MHDCVQESAEGASDAVAEGVPGHSVSEVLSVPEGRSVVPDVLSVPVGLSVPEALSVPAGRSVLSVAAPAGRSLQSAHSVPAMGAIQAVVEGISDVSSADGSGAMVGESSVLSLCFLLVLRCAYGYHCVCACLCVCVNLRCACFEWRVW